jgi:hypothetical protein
MIILSCLENGPQWWQIGRQVAWSLGVWVFFIVTSPLNAYVFGNSIAMEHVHSGSRDMLEQGFVLLKISLLKQSYVYFRFLVLFVQFGFG